jgi:hypothetical protein
MSDLDKYFNSGAEEISHPRIVGWGALIKSEEISVQCEIFRKREGLTFTAPRIYLHHTIKQTGQRTTDPEEWDDVLNFWLIDNGVQAISPENEALRFGLMLRRMLQRAETRYGEGYFNAVLLGVISDGFSSDTEIKTMLGQIDPLQAHKGRSYEEAVAMIESVFKECATLLKKLKYPVESAKNILTRAVGLYLDERFSITNLKLMGWT